MSDPLHQFVITPIFKLKIAGHDLSFTNSSLAIMICTVLICALFGLGVRKKALIPNRLQALVESSYAIIAGTVRENIGTAGMQYFPFIFSVFFLILAGNLLGMIPHMFTFTSHIIVTFVLALIVMSFITILGFVKHGVKFLGVFAPKGLPTWLIPFIAPIEIISYLVRPISLSIRLAANMTAGHIVLKIFAGLSLVGGTYGAMTILLNSAITGLEVVVAVIQAYIFTILTCVYLNDAVNLH